LINNKLSLVTKVPLIRLYLNDYDAYNITYLLKEWSYNVHFTETHANN